MTLLKEKLLNDFPGLREQFVTRLRPIGRKGFSTLKTYLQIWDGPNLVCEESTEKRAYLVAATRLRRRKSNT